MTWKMGSFKEFLFTGDTSIQLFAFGSSWMMDGLNINFNDPGEDSTVPFGFVSRMGLC